MSSHAPGERAVLPPRREPSRRMVAVSPDAAPVERAQLQEREIEKLNMLLETARALGQEVDLDKLLGKVIELTSKMMACDRSSAFLVDRKAGELYTLVAQGLGAQEVRLSMESGLVGYVARTGEILNVPDAYQDPRFNRSFDQATGYRTHSVLAMPMPDRRGEVLGVLQCLNRQDPQGAPRPFDAEDEAFLGTLAGLVAMFLENAKLYREMDHLLRSMVSAISRSIDDRDPCTSGHSRRVTLYSMNLARAVHDCERAPFDQVRYTRERMRQLHFAGLLHDVGKIGVREYILCKADKLPANGFELIRTRLEAEVLRARLACVEEALARQRAVADDAAVRALEAQAASAVELVGRCNQPGRLSDDDLTRLKALLERGWLTQAEHDHLSIRKGNLTDEEWDDMRSHVTKSYEMLVRIPWPRELAEVPEVAYTHHEKRDGSGYPRGLKGDAIHFDGQVMCVCDIYDALTASDRPYKKALPHEVAKKILVEEEAKNFRLMPELVTLFFEQECFKITDEMLKQVDPLS